METDREVHDMGTEVRDRRPLSYYHHALVVFGLCTPPGEEGQKSSNFLFAEFLSVTVSNDKVCELHVAMKSLEYRNGLVPLDRQG